MKRILLPLAALALLSLQSCENYSNGERVGFITKLSQSGALFKSWEGHLNASQTGMNSAAPFDFSLDNDDEPAGVRQVLDSAAEYGWKVKLTYHGTWGKNWLNNRGATDYFVEAVEVLDRNPMGVLTNQQPAAPAPAPAPRPADTTFTLPPANQ